MTRTWMALGICAVVAMASAQLVPLDARQAASASSDAKVAVATVNLNNASSAELEKLPGIGPATAGRIIEYRQKNGGFKKIEDLMNVRGIGEASFLKLKSQITVTPMRTSEK